MRELRISRVGAVRRRNKANIFTQFNTEQVAKYKLFQNEISWLGKTKGEGICKK